MRVPHIQSRRSQWAVRGFSLAELMVAVGLLSIIVLVLYAMFDQTQKALRASVGQVDVMEGSRTAMEILSRDLEEVRPVGIDDGPHLITRLAVPPGLIQQQAALFQERQPALQEVFALRRIADHRWFVIGYFIGNENDPRQPMTPPIGTLYRYEDRIKVGRPAMSGADEESLEFELVEPGFRSVQLSTRAPFPAALLVRNLIRLPFDRRDLFRSPTNAARVMEGVLNFRVTPYDRQGHPYNWTYQVGNLPERPDVPLQTLDPLQPVILNHVIPGLVTETTFSGMAMPSYLEVELDALDPRLLEQFRSLPPNADIRNRFLTNNLSRIMSFRQRIPLRASVR